MTQREFKFRVWDKKIQSMQNHDWLFAAQVRYDALFKERDDICVMQFTGMKDKDNVEIYEGDIVVHNGEHCVVNFKGGSFGIDYQLTARSKEERIISSTKWEVLGNIFEHNHLLTS